MQQRLQRRAKSEPHSVTPALYALAIAYLWSMSIARAVHTHALVSSPWSRVRGRACAERCLPLHGETGARRYSPAWWGALPVHADAALRPQETFPTTEGTRTSCVCAAMVILWAARLARQVFMGGLKFMKGGVLEMRLAYITDIR